MSTRDSKGKSAPPIGGLGPSRRSGSGGGDGSDGRSTPPEPGPGPGRWLRSGRGGGGWSEEPTPPGLGPLPGSGRGGGSGSKSTPPGPRRLLRSGRGGGAGSEGTSTPPSNDGKSTPPTAASDGKSTPSTAASDGNSTPSTGGTGPFQQSGKGGRGCRNDSQGRPPLGPAQKRTGRGSSERRPRPAPSEVSFGNFLEAAMAKSSQKKKTVSPVHAPPLEGNDKSTGEDFSGLENIELDPTPSETPGYEKIITQSSGSSAPRVPDKSSGEDMSGLVNAEEDDKSRAPSETPGNDKSRAPSETHENPKVITRSSGSSVLIGTVLVVPGKSPGEDTSGLMNTEEDPSPSKTPGNKKTITQSSGSSEQEKQTPGQATPPIQFQSERSTQQVSPVTNIQVSPVSAQTKEEFFRSLFQDFLQSYGPRKVFNGESLGYYETQLKIMALCRRFVFKVKFKDLLKDKKYIHLAMEIANHGDREDGWLQAVAQDFMMRSFKEEDRENLRLQISGKPERMRRFKSISVKELVRKVKVIIGEDKIPALTAFGRHAYMCVLWHILDSHDQGISWSGKFELEDIYILFFPNSLQCWIAKETGWEDKKDISCVDWCSADQKVLDLHKLDTVLTDHYIDGATVPLYFDQLRTDLQKVGVIYLHDNPWFVTYLRFHVALMSSTARKCLINELFHLMSVYKLLSDNKQNQTSAFKSFQYWILDLWSRDNPLLMAVYKHENPAYKDESTTKQKAGECNIKKKKAGNNSISDSKGDSKPDRYDERLGSALSYKRHLIWHLHNNVENAHLIENFDGIELYAASKLPRVLPELIKALLEENNMAGRFKKPWSAYCTMHSDKAA